MNNVEESYKKKLLEIIAEYLPGCHIYLFGSRARGTNKQGSDIDLALDAGKLIDLKIMGLIRATIEDSNIPFFVDVVDMHSVSTEMLEEITREGILWST